VNLQWTTASHAARARITRTIAQDNLSAARKLNKKFQDSARGLLAHPYRGRKGRVDGTRELVVHPNYLLIYEIDGETIRILTVLHAAQRWP